MGSVSLPPCSEELDQRVGKGGDPGDEPAPSSTETKCSAALHTLLACGSWCDGPSGAHTGVILNPRLARLVAGDRLRRRELWFSGRVTGFREASPALTLQCTSLAPSRSACSSQVTTLLWEACSLVHSDLLSPLLSNFRPFPEWTSRPFVHLSPSQARSHQAPTRPASLGTSNVLVPK